MEDGLERTCSLFLPRWCRGQTQAYQSLELCGNTSQPPPKDLKTAHQRYQMWQHSSPVLTMVLSTQILRRDQIKSSMLYLHLLIFWNLCLPKASWALASLPLGQGFPANPHHCPYLALGKGRGMTMNKSSDCPNVLTISNRQVMGMHKGVRIVGSRIDM